MFEKQKTEQQLRKCNILEHPTVILLKNVQFSKAHQGQLVSTECHPREDSVTVADHQFQNGSLT